MAWIIRGKKIYDKYKTDEMTVYAAQVSFFVMLSFVPFIMLLLTAVQMIPAISQAEVLELVVELTPADYKSLAFRIVNDLSLKSPATMISVTAVTALWSAGRGMFSMARGLDRVWGKEDKYWYVISRLICCGYTIVFVAVCLLSLILLVFGQILQGFLEAHFPFVGVITGTVIDLRAIWFFLVLFVFFLGIYTFVPEKRLRVRDQIPGALLFPSILTGWEAADIPICTGAWQPSSFCFYGCISACVFSFWAQRSIISGQNTGHLWTAGQRSRSRNKILRQEKWQ